MIKVLTSIQWLMGRLASLTARLAPDYFAPVMQWRAPPGPHAAGFCDNDLTLDDGTRLMLRTWYPAEKPGNQSPEPYLSEREVSTMIAGMGQALSFSPFLVRRLAKAQTHSYREARPASTETPFPLIVFSHGFSGTVNQNTALAEHLASLGYVVASVAYPGGASAVHYTDHKTAVMTAETKAKLVNPDLIRAALAIKKAKSLKELHDAIAHYAVTEPMHGEHQRWTQTLRNLLDALQNADALPISLATVLKLADIQRLGLMGHSFGGATSAAAAQDDSRVRAVANLDGGQFGMALFDKTVSAPLLMLYSETATLGEQRAFNDFHYETHAEAGLSTRVQRYIIRQANHLDYTDMTLFGRGIVKTSLGRGRFEGQPMLDAVADMVTAFFDQHLKSEADTLQQTAAQHTAIAKQDLSAVREMKG